MQGLTDAGNQLVADVASRHGVSMDAVHTLLMALAAGGGSQAQFNHPELGGMGQWSQGGMIMVGDMFNQGLKYRVDALCNDLAGAMRDASPFAPAPMSRQSQSQSGSGYAGGVSLFVPGAFGEEWPAGLGAAASTGSQNDLHYAVFPETNRLAIRQGGRTTLYDLADHRISGFSQQQGGDQSLTFTSQHGLVRVADLRVVSDPGAAPPPPEVDFAPAPAPSPAAPPAPAGGHPAPGHSDDEIFTRLERLAELYKKDVITAEDFAAKKAELLARL